MINSHEIYAELNEMLAQRRHFIDWAIPSIHELSMNTDMPMDVVTKCPMCGKLKPIFGRVGAFYSWLRGACIQHTDLKELSVDDREALITGTCPSCWKKIFPDDPEEVTGEEITIHVR